MKAGNLIQADGKQSKEIVLVMTYAEARALHFVVELAAEKKIKGSKPILSRLNTILECF